MALAPGVRLGPYEIVSALGAGGMGEVYKARDTRLERTVAIKVLPEHVATDPELKQRFEREAKTISSLNHPHICTLHDVGSQDGVDFLVMEHLEGETLAQRLTTGALPLDQALQTAIQIADALDKAHRQGITHRDLKPGNIMLTKAGAKLLDFGLAKLRPAGATGDVGLSAAPTVSSPLTGAGTILGTFQYMAPEQLEGQETDARTDIFAFGAVVYEMVTGKKAFEGKSQASLIAAILEREPVPMSSLQSMSPPALDRVVKTCLAKDPEDRWQAARDLHRELKWIAEAGEQVGVPTSTFPVPRPPGWRRMLPLAGVLVAGSFITGLAFWTLAAPGPSAPAMVTRLTIAPLQTAPMTNLTDLEIAISPDGTRIVYSATDAESGQRMLFVRNIDALEVRVVPGTEGGEEPFFSPDGEWLGFETGEGALMKVPVNGGIPVTILDEVGEKQGVTWAPDDTVIFATQFDGLYRVSAGGGSSAERLPSDAPRVRSPLVLPGGQAVIFQAGVPGNVEADYLAVLSLETGEQRTLIERAVAPSYVASGHLVFVRGNTLMATPFDAEQLELTGDPIPLLVGIRRDVAADYALSANGTLAYVPGEDESSPQRTLVWVDRDGREEPVGAPPRQYTYPRVSPSTGPALPSTCETRMNGHAGSGTSADEPPPV